MKYSADEWIDRLGMQEHYEGGYYKFIGKSDITVSKSMLPGVFQGDRSLFSLIYYLLKPGQVSCWHKLLSEEIWFWHYGGTLEMTLGIGEDAPVEERKILIGPDIAGHESLQAIVPAGYWQTTSPVGSDFVLVSCVVSPGFEKEDFILPGRV